MRETAPPELRTRLANLRATQLIVPSGDRFLLQLWIEALEAEAASTGARDSMRMIQPRRSHRGEPVFTQFIEPLRQQEA